MKKMFLGMIALIGAMTLQAQQNDNEVVTKEVSVGSFSALNLNGVANVHLIQGSQPSVKVEAAEKMHERLDIKTEGNTLYVKSRKGNWNNWKKITIYITFTALTEIQNSLVGNLSSDNVIQQKALRYKSGAVGNTKLQLEVDDLQLNIASVGNTELSGKAHDCELKNSSVGNVRAGELIVENMDLNTSAVGNLEYHANNTVGLKSNGVGKVTNKRKKGESR
jgi:hypothetical protein